MKVQVSVDAEHGLVHTVAKASDVAQTDALLHDDEDGDKGYTTTRHNLSTSYPRRGPLWGFPYKRPAGGELPEWKRKINRQLASLHAKVEHPFRVLKRQFGYTKVR